MNASLAVQLAHYWLCKYNRPQHEVSTLLTKEGCSADVIPLNSYVDALTNTKWLGRCETIDKGSVVYYLDGAHTIESMKNCCDWFDESIKDDSVENQASVSKKKTKANKTARKLRVLVFNCTGQRDPAQMLKIIHKLGFDFAIFTTNRVNKQKRLNADNTNFTVTEQQETNTCQKNVHTWLELDSKAKVLSVPCISDAIQRIDEIQCNNGPVQVLVTGSIHLVGGFLSILHPDYSQNNSNEIS